MRKVFLTAKLPMQYVASIGGMVLQGSALVLMSVGGGWVVIRALRTRAPWLPRPHSTSARRAVTHPIWDAEASLARTTAHGMEHMMWRGTNWMLALGLESMLAAQIIQVSIASAEQNGLSWWRMSVVVLIAFSGILF